MSNAAGRMGIGIISAGKVGVALGSALRAAGHVIIGAHARSEESRDRLEAILPGVPALDVEEIVERSEMVILALPADELGGLVADLAERGAWQAGQVVVHTAAEYGVEVLEPAAKAGALAVAIHPAMDFSGTSLDVARLAGCHFAVSGAAPLQPIGLALVAEMGGQGIVIDSADRPSYAAALHGVADAIQRAAAEASQAIRAITRTPGAMAAFRSNYSSAGHSGTGSAAREEAAPGETANTVTGQTVPAETAPGSSVPGEILRSLATSALERGLSGDLGG